MSRQKNALANLSAVMQKLVQSESEAETISLQPNWFLERAVLNLPSFPHQQLSFHFHVEARKWLQEEEQWWSALASERNGSLETMCAGQGPGEFQVQDLSSPRTTMSVSSSDYVQHAPSFVSQGNAPELCCPEVLLGLGHRDMIQKSGWHLWLRALTMNFIVHRDVRWGPQHWANKTTLQAGSSKGL